MNTARQTAVMRQELLTRLRSRRCIAIARLYLVSSVLASAARHRRWAVRGRGEVMCKCKINTWAAAAAFREKGRRGLQGIQGGARRRGRLRHHHLRRIGMPVKQLEMVLNKEAAAGWRCSRSSSSSDSGSLETRDSSRHAGPLARLVLAFIHCYQAAGGGERIFAVQCNFTPTCPIMRQGQSNASVCGAARLAWRRIRRCNRRDLLERIDDPLPERLP